MVEGVWTLNDVRGVLERSDRVHQGKSAMSRAIQAEISTVVSTLPDADKPLREECLGRLSSCLSASAQHLIDANTKNNSLTALCEPVDANQDGEDVESITSSVARISGLSMEFLNGSLDYCHDVATTLCAPLLLAFKALLGIRGSDVVAVLKPLKRLVNGCVMQLEQLQRPEANPGEASESNENDINFDEYGGGMDIGELNLPLFEAQHCISNNEALKTLREVLAVILNEIRPSARYNYSTNLTLVRNESRDKILKRGEGVRVSAINSDTVANICQWARCRGRYG